MDFCDKLRELRKERGLTQQQLADKLYVSRTAVSKWESGGGFPSIESLRALASVFSVTLDSLLSFDEAIYIADAERREREERGKNFIFGFADLFLVLSLFLPIFAVRGGAEVSAVSLLSLGAAPLGLRAVCYIFSLLPAAFGVALFVLQNCRKGVWLTYKYRISFFIGIASLFAFIATLQPYAAALVLFSLVIKAFFSLKC